MLFSPCRISLAGDDYAIALPMSSLDTSCSHGLVRLSGRGDRPPVTDSPKTEVPGELELCSVLKWLLIAGSSTAYQVDGGCSGYFRSLLVRSGLQRLFPLMLLLLLFDLACPGGSFESREFCRFGCTMNGSAPGTTSSVRPARAFGAWA